MSGFSRSGVSYPGCQLRVSRFWVVEFRGFGFEDTRLGLFEVWGFGHGIYKLRGFGYGYSRFKVSGGFEVRGFTVLGFQGTWFPVRGVASGFRRSGFRGFRVLWFPVRGVEVRGFAVQSFEFRGFVVRGVGSGFRSRWGVPGYEVSGSGFPVRGFQVRGFLFGVSGTGL